jgi:hypothetical protein
MGFTAIRRKIGSCTRSSIRHGACPTIHPLAVAMMRTATRLKSNTSMAASTQSAEKTESTFAFHLRRWSGTGTIPMAETTSAPRRPAHSGHRIRFSASHSEAQHEVHFGEWQDTLPAVLLCAVQ